MFAKFPLLQIGFYLNDFHNSLTLMMYFVFQPSQNEVHKKQANKKSILTTVIMIRVQSLTMYLLCCWGFVFSNFLSGKMDTSICKCPWPIFTHCLLILEAIQPNHNIIPAPQQYTTTQRHPQWRHNAAAAPLGHICSFVFLHIDSWVQKLYHCLNTTEAWEIKWMKIGI